MFFGRVFSAEGYSPDPEKIQGIQDDTTPDKARATIIPWSSKLPADICPSSQLKHWAPPGPQKGELLCLGQEHPTHTSRK